ncbi:unnamed protein product [Schistocephalus solidus]|uniref:Uncharacterized protein n=1 Tax=Schistocephalus solidus TaxID=70667 RepID=A0A183SGV6_SCHSO|nr:unnamed protein product [Schistocephalus solidus]
MLPRSRTTKPLALFETTLSGSGSPWPDIPGAATAGRREDARQPPILSVADTSNYTGDGGTPCNNQQTTPAHLFVHHLWCLLMVHRMYKLRNPRLCDLSALPVETLAPFGLCPRPEARSTGRASDKGDPRCQQMDGSPPRHLQEEASSATTQETPSNKPANRRANFLLAEADTSVENRWCQLRDTVQFTTLDVLVRARPQHEAWFNENEATVNAPLVEKNQLHKAYVDRPITAFYRSRRPVQQRLREMQDAWMTRKAEEMQGPRAFTHRMGLLGHMQIHESGIHRNASTSRAPINASKIPPRSSTTSTRITAPQTQLLPTYLVLIITEHAHHASPWLVTCKSTAQRPAIQGQEH